MVFFSRIPFHQFLVATLLGVISGTYIFAPGIIDFARQHKLNEDLQTTQTNIVETSKTENETANLIN